MDRPDQQRPGSTPRPEWLGAPNMLSLARLPLGGLFWLTIGPSPDHIVWPFAVLAAAAITDVLDGILARRSGITSGVGSWLDPICDKLFVGAVLGAIAFYRHPPLSLLALIVGRELVQLPLSLTYRFVPVLRLWLRYDFHASFLGKAATVAQFLAVAALLVDHEAKWAVAWATFGVGMLALGDYLRRAVAIGRARLGRRGGDGGGGGV